MVFPRAVAGDRAALSAREAELTAGIRRLYEACYLDARLSIHGRRWGDALVAIGRIFRFAYALIGAWDGSQRHVSGGAAMPYGYSAAVELSVQPDVDRECVRAAGRLVEGTPTAPDAFVDASQRPFWGTVTAFLDRLDGRADASTVMRSLLDDAAFREALTDSRFALTASLDLEQPAVLYPRYPALALERQGGAMAGEASCGARWISERCVVAFDKVETVSVLEAALGGILAHGGQEPRLFRRSIGAAAGQGFPTYRLAALLDAAAAGSTFRAKRALAGIRVPEPAFHEGGYPRTPSERCWPRTRCRRATRACRRRCGSGKLCSCTREVCRTLIALARHVQRHWVLPRDMGSLVREGYLASLPRDPYSGDPIGYDRERGRVFLRAAAAKMIPRITDPDEGCGECPGICTAR